MGGGSREIDRIWARAAVALIQIVGPIALVVLGLFLIGHQSTWLMAALAVITAIIGSTAATLLVSRYFLSRAESVLLHIDEEISAYLDNVSHVVAIRAEGSRSGWTQQQLAEYESRIDVETVWIAGENFDSEVASDSPFREVVRNNIYQRGINYVYIAPESTEIDHMFSSLREELDLENDDPRLVTIFLPKDKWESMPYTAGNFTIYDPVGKGRVPQGFCWDPGGDGESFIELRHRIDRWIWNIEDLCPELDPRLSR